MSTSGTWGDAAYMAGIKAGRLSAESQLREAQQRIAALEAERDEAHDLLNEMLQNLAARREATATFTQRLVTALTQSRAQRQAG